MKRILSKGHQGKLSSTSNNATLKTISSLAGQYDGMKIGMKMVK